MFLAALRAAGWRGRRPHPAGSRVARWTIAPPASLPAELPHRTTYPTNSLLTAARRRGWCVDAQSSAAKPVTSARGWNPVRWGGSRARTPGSRLPHRAQGLEQVPSVCSGLRPLRPAGFIPARPYQSECAAGGRYGALETALGGRMPPMLRNPLRPGGPRKTNPATVRISTKAAGRMPASIGVSGILGEAAGRGVDAQA